MVHFVLLLQVSWVLAQPELHLVKVISFIGEEGTACFSLTEENIFLDVFERLHLSSLLRLHDRIYWRLKMAAAKSSAVGENSRSLSSGLSSIQPPLGPQCCFSDPGFSTHINHPMLVPPTMYSHAPPPPPFLHYQWPTHFPFPPFAGYPGRSFGMFVAPPPYLEAPAYVLPQPQIQPVNYGRLLHPQYPGPYNHIRRTLPPFGTTRTVNREVQTELNLGAYRVGWPPDVSDSGQGTGSNASHSPGSSSPKQDPAEGGTYENENCVQLIFSGMYAGSGAGDGTDNEDVAHARDDETLFKVLRRADPELCLESWETVEPVDLAFCERPSLSSRERLQCSINSSCMFLDGEPENSNGTNLHYDLTDIAPNKMSSKSCPVKPKLNESIWSVESLEPFIPSREWLVENGLVEPEIKLVEEARKESLSESDDQIVKVDKERRQSWRWFSMSVQMSEDGLDINVQDEQKSPRQVEVEKERDQSAVHSEHDSLSFPTPLSSEAVYPTNENNKRSSEPEATQRPNQEVLIRNELQEESCSEETLLQSLAENISFPKQRFHHTEGAGAPVALQKMTQVFPSKSHLMDLGVQCSKGQEPKCFCRLLTYRPNKNNHLNIQMSGTIKLQLSGSTEMCRKSLVSEGVTRDSHTNQQEPHSGYD